MICYVPWKFKFGHEEKIENYVELLKYVIENTHEDKSVEKYVNKLGIWVTQFWERACLKYQGKGEWETWNALGNQQIIWWLTNRGDDDLVQ